MSEYYPDGWVLLKINGTDPHYRIFASFRGGYASGDAWRMNSGITSVEEDENFYYFYGYTGSLYKCHKQSYDRLGMYVWGVLKDFLDKSGDLVEAYAFNEYEELDVMGIDWKCSNTGEGQGINEWV